MKIENLTKEMREEILATYAEYLPAKRIKAANFNSCKEAEDYDDIILAPGQDKDYKISYWDKNGKETHICLAGMNELDAEHRFNNMFPGNIFICVKEIKI